MDEVLLKFSVVGQKIFKQLDDKSLARSREINKIVLSFLDNGSMLWRRRINKYAKNQIEFYKDWKLVTKKVSLQVMKELALATEEFYTHSHCSKKW